MTEPNKTVLPRKHTRSLAQELMNQLSSEILNGTYHAGDKLPTEPEIMVKQGVSRTVVREAMSRLQATGLVETRHGVGTFVLAREIITSQQLDFSTMMTIRDVLDMLELRISLETEAAGLAALRRTDTQLSLMQQAIDEFEIDINQDNDAVKADFQFHLLIAQATNNKYFEDFYRHLGTMTIPRTRLDTSQFSDNPSANYLQQTNQEHRTILNALTRQDAQSARACMYMHLTNSRERLKRASDITDL